MIFLSQLSKAKAKISLEGPSLHPGKTSQIKPTEDDLAIQNYKIHVKINKQNNGRIRHSRVQVIKRPIKNYKMSLVKNIEDTKEGIKIRQESRKEKSEKRDKENFS